MLCEKLYPHVTSLFVQQLLQTTPRTADKLIRTRRCHELPKSQPPRAMQLQ